MGFLRDIEEGREDDFDEDSGPRLEEKYMRLFPKIGRDFIHREDFIDILTDLMLAIDPELINRVALHDTTHAEDRALEYKRYLNNNIPGSEMYPDLIDLSED